MADANTFVSGNISRAKAKLNNNLPPEDLGPIPDEMLTDTSIGTGLLKLEWIHLLGDVVDRFPKFLEQVLRLLSHERDVEADHDVLLNTVAYRERNALINTVAGRMADIQWRDAG